MCYESLEDKKEILPICVSSKTGWLLKEVQITQKGINVLSELDPKVIEHENALTSNLNAVELEQLNTLLEKYRNQ